MDGVLAFCCTVCRCRPGAKSGDTVEEHLAADDGKEYVLLHRRCCHGIQPNETVPFDWKSKYGIARESVPANKKSKKSTISRASLLKFKEQMDRETVMIANEACLPNVSNMRYTDPRYDQIQLRFKTIKNSRNSNSTNTLGHIHNPNKRPANILDLFSGIGSGILCLKRNAVAINNVVTVEHDPIAHAVCEFHHKNDAVENGGKFVHYEKFEQLEQTLDEVMEQHGPFDIIIGGPPCVEFSGVNANRSGVESERGSYMLEFANLVKRIRNHNYQKGRELFFLCENVKIEGKDGQEIIERAFGISPVEIDAKNFSPSKRRRAYYTNIPVKDIPDDHSMEGESCVSSVLNDGWMHPADACNDGTPTVCKANTFMASSGRIDDERMMKVRKIPDKSEYKTGYYTVEEREALMGFPDGYVQHVVTNIFDDITKSFHSEDWVQAATGPETGIFHNPYDKLLELSGLDYRFEYAIRGSHDPVFKVKVGTRERNGEGTDSLYYYDAEDYSKRLIGNAFSIPVVEHLLVPLKDLFESCVYDDAQYHFRWPPHIFKE